jgi:cell division protein YceG involved in septum cleavage
MKTKKTMRGVSEIVVVLALILVAVVAVFAVRGWLASQQSRLTNMDMATASYTVSFGQGNMAIVSLLVRNNLQNPLSVLGYNITLSNGTVLSPVNATISPQIPATGYQVSAKSDATFTITFSVTPGVAIRDIRVLVQDASSGQQQWITAIGGG